MKSSESYLCVLLFARCTEAAGISCILLSLNLLWKTAHLIQSFDVILHYLVHILAAQRLF